MFRNCMIFSNTNPTQDMLYTVLFGDLINVLSKETPSMNTGTNCMKKNGFLYFREMLVLLGSTSPISGLFFLYLLLLIIVLCF